MKKRKTTRNCFALICTTLARIIKQSIKGPGMEVKTKPDTRRRARAHMYAYARGNRKELTHPASFLRGEYRTKSARVWGAGFKKMQRV